MSYIALSICPASLKYVLLLSSIIKVRSEECKEFDKYKCHVVNSIILNLKFFRLTFYFIKIAVIIFHWFWNSVILSLDIFSIKKEVIFHQSFQFYKYRLSVSWGRVRSEKDEACSCVHVRIATRFVVRTAHLFIMNS